MRNLNFHDMETEKFKEAIQSVSCTEILNNIETMSNEQLSIFVNYLAQESDPEWQTKLIAILSGLNDREALEVIGKSITPALFLEALKRKNSIDSEILRKIPPLLVGMEHQVFCKLLDIIDSEQLGILLQESSTEPLQHQITLFSHEVIYQLEVMTQTLRSLEQEIEAFEVSSISHHTIEDFHQKIGAIGSEVKATIHRINNALAMAWNTTREDLIDSLSFQKECWQKYDALVIGIPEYEEMPASGLYARLEERLNAIFGNPNDLNDIKALHDDEPAIEALAKFSLWYLQDYLEIGLLPNITDIKELDLDSKKHTDRERSDYRATLFSQAQKTLELVGLKTVTDLKKAQVYSKEMLKNHIEKHLSKALYTNPNK
ncbi:MAG: hypothetical protein VX777_06110 [Chlamydiota bacterium]|nr:hypothetical protein [Chlamydiota bacterium]